MSKNYTQLSLEQRYQIEALVKAGVKQKSIAEQLQVSPSTISRELKRNVAKRGPTAGTYQARLADRRTRNRHHIKPKRVIFDDEMKKNGDSLSERRKMEPGVNQFLRGLCEGKP